MAKFTDTTVLDAALDQIASSTQMWLCSGQPTSYSGIAAVALTSAITMAPGDFTKGAGNPDGRAVTVAGGKTGNVTTTGKATHYVLATASVLKFVTACTGPDLTAGSSVNVNGFTHRIAQPT